MIASNTSLLSSYTAVILAGGLGTRLRSLYDGGPKAMAPVRGRPFLEFLLHRLERAGLCKVVLCVGYRHESIMRHIGDGRNFGVEVFYSVEDEPLGTGGALRLAASSYSPTRTFFCMNGDTYVVLDYHAMLNAHRLGKARATIALVTATDSSQVGSVAIDKSGRVLSFHEKVETSNECYANAGTYVFEPNVIDMIPEKTHVSLERDIIPKIAPGEMNSFLSRGPLLDIGTPAEFLRAQTELPEITK